MCAKKNSVNEREQRIRDVMVALGLHRAEAEEVVAIERGESSGCIRIVDEPEDAPPTHKNKTRGR